MVIWVANEKNFKILSIDDGIRGMLPAMLIAEIEKRLRMATGKTTVIFPITFGLKNMSNNNLRV